MIVVTVNSLTYMFGNTFPPHPRDMHGFTSMAKIVSASSSVEVFAKASSISTYGIVVVVQNPLRCGQSLASTRTHLVHHARNSSSE